MSEIPDLRLNILLGQALTQNARLEDDYFFARFGWKISKLREIEMLVARYSTSDTLTPEGERERDQLITNYKEVWRPRRLHIERIKNGIRDLQKG